jgi:hypothetical protein
MANAFAFGIAVEPGTPDQFGLTIIEHNDEHDAASFIVRRTLTDSIDESVETVAEDIQGRLAEAPYTARSSVVVHVGNELGHALADALSDLGMRPVRVRVRSANDGTAAESDAEAVIDAREELVALSNAHRTGALRVEHRNTEDAAHLARTLGHLVDDSNEGSEISTHTLDVQGTSALLAYWWSTEQTADPTERLRADLPGTEPSQPTP